MLDGEDPSQKEAAEIPSWQPEPIAPPSGFRGYIETRKYDFGRGRPETWAFIAFMRGEPDFPEVDSWRGLRLYLQHKDAGQDIVRGGHSAWRSFTAFRSRNMNREL